VSFNPLALDNESAYQKWRETKIAAYEKGEHNARVDIAGVTASTAELSQLMTACQTFNYCTYRMARADAGNKRFVVQTGLSLGLSRLDGNLCSDEDNISAIQVQKEGRQGGYIPYTDKKLTWHTDGYYNEPSRAIRAMVLHCVRPAQNGGENLLLDHEMAYIQLRDESPRFIEAFAQLDVLTIPPNIENGVQIRGAQSGPVFSFDPSSSALHMRFSARTRNIVWKNDSLTSDAVACMNQLLCGNNPYITSYRMRAGEGIIANNVLHNRTAFIDAPSVEHKRLLYRARYYDRVKCSPVREK